MHLTVHSFIHFWKTDIISDPCNLPTAEKWSTSGRLGSGLGTEGTFTEKFYCAAMVFRYTEEMKKDDQRNAMVYKEVNLVPQEPSIMIVAEYLGGDGFGCLALLSMRIDMVELRRLSRSSCFSLKIHNCYERGK